MTSETVSFPGGWSGREPSLDPPPPLSLYGNVICLGEGHWSRETCVVPAQGQLSLRIQSCPKDYRCSNMWLFEKNNTKCLFETQRYVRHTSECSNTARVPGFLSVIRCSELQTLTTTRCNVDADARHFLTSSWNTTWHVLRLMQPDRDSLPICRWRLLLLHDNALKKNGTTGLFIKVSVTKTTKLSCYNAREATQKVASCFMSRNKHTSAAQGSKKEHAMATSVESDPKSHRHVVIKIF